MPLPERKGFVRCFYADMLSIMSFLDLVVFDVPL